MIQGYSKWSFGFIWGRKMVEKAPRKASLKVTIKIKCSKSTFPNTQYIQQPLNKTIMETVMLITMMTRITQLKLFNTWSFQTLQIMYVQNTLPRGSDVPQWTTLFIFFQKKTIKGTLKFKGVCCIVLYHRIPPHRFNHVLLTRPDLTLKALTGYLRSKWQLPYYLVGNRKNRDGRIQAAPDETRPDTPPVCRNPLRTWRRSPEYSPPAILHIAQSQLLFIWGCLTSQWKTCDQPRHAFTCVHCQLTKTGLGWFQGVHTRTWV